MPRPEKQFAWNYSDIEKLTGLTQDAIRQHVARKKLTDDLEGLVIYLATHASPALREKLNRVILTRVGEEEVGVVKSRRPVKKKKARA